MGHKEARIVLSGEVRQAALRLIAHARLQKVGQCADPFDVAFDQSVARLEGFRDALQEYCDFNNGGIAFSRAITGTSIVLVQGVVDMLRECRDNTPRNLLNTQFNKIIASFENVVLSELDKQMKPEYVKEVKIIKEDMARLLGSVPAEYKKSNLPEPAITG
ncbi:MAG: hypothetical protein KGI37_01935 [Alphaproteobacteria bacterium]|nr:hypothetical protein [Alphaproteobacteria bacterium]